MRATIAEREGSGRQEVRSGRPRRENAGKVEERILRAAAKVFVERGFEGASIDEIALEARAGKPTIYARFPGKDALFSAVIAREIEEKARFEDTASAGLTSEERLKALATAISARALTSDTVGLMRAAIAESRRFPDLARRVHAMVRERGNEAVARVLGELARSDRISALPAFAPDRLAATARRFTEVAIMPIVLSVLFGETPEAAAAEIEPHVTEAVAFFLAACRAGGGAAPAD